MQRMLDQDTILKAAAEAAMREQGQPLQQAVPPQPVPMTVQLSTVQDIEGNKFVVLIINHPLGQSVYHFTPEGADQISEGLKQAAGLSKSGLHIAR